VQQASAGWRRSNPGKRREDEMKRLTAILVASLVMTGTAVGAACGSGSDKCPGITCTNCSPSGDCNLTCPTGQVNACVSAAQYGGSSSERCSYCTKP
jgi:hypothetical protein